MKIVLVEDEKEEASKKETVKETRNGNLLLFSEYLHNSHSSMIISAIKLNLSTKK